MGSHGPIPKRSEERRRENKPETPIDKVQVTGRVEIPPVNPKWHAIAKRIYQSLAPSGQSKFYEESDWATAYLLAESLSRDLKPQHVAYDEEKHKIIRAYLPLKGGSLSAYLKAFAALGMTEGDRRRMGIEITRSGDLKEAVSDIDAYRHARNG